MLVEFSMFPLDKGESVGKYVARSLEIVEKSGLDYRLNDMGTVIEGSWDEVFAVIRQCHKAMNRDCRRIHLSVKADHRDGSAKMLGKKVRSVQKRLGKKLKT